MNILKAVLFTLILFALLLLASSFWAKVDSALGLLKFQSRAAILSGIIFLSLGVILRFWATMLFYQNRLKVISPRPQQTLVTGGPYQFSRNPLYLGMILILLGTALLLGSPMALLFSLVAFGIFNWWAKVEEGQLTSVFGQEYLQFKNQVRRWF